MPQKYKSKMAAPAILNFAKVRYWATVTPIWPISASVSILTKISSFTTEI